MAHEQRKTKNNLSDGIGHFDKNSRFTAQQLAALTTRYEFEIIDCPGIFGVSYTSFAKAIDETFNDPIYSKIVLEF